MDLKYLHDLASKFSLARFYYIDDCKCLFGFDCEHLVHSQTIFSRPILQPLYCMPHDVQKHKVVNFINIFLSGEGCGCSTCMFNLPRLLITFKLSTLLSGYCKFFQCMLQIWWIWVEIVLIPSAFFELIYIILRENYFFLIKELRRSKIGLCNC